MVDIAFQISVTLDWRSRSDQVAQLDTTGEQSAEADKDANECTITFSLHFWDDVHVSNG